MTLRGALLDSGDTLIGPVGGRWNPRFDFEEVVLRHVPETSLAAMPEAISAGERFMRGASAAWSRDDYHRAVLAALGIGHPSAELLAELDRPLPFSAIVAPFPDTRPTLQALQARRVGIAVVSDAQASMQQAYVDLDLARYVEAFVISAVLGCTKPDPRMYRAGSEGLGLSPTECLFVDDDPELVAAALALGYEGRVMCRSGVAPPGDLPWISSLAALLDLFPVHAP